MALKVYKNSKKKLLKLLCLICYFISKMVKSKEENYDHLFRSDFDEDGIRLRFLRLKERERFEYLGLEMTKCKRFYIARIYTVDQAIERGIKFRREYWEDLEGVERKYWNKTAYSQKDDWVVTSKPTPDGEYWVMQVLWRNGHHAFPYIRTATGTYPIFYRHLKPFDGADLKYQFRISKNPLYSGDKRLTPRLQLLVTFMANLIMRLGYFNKYVVALAYRSTYGYSATNRIIFSIMGSHKIMSRLAEELAKKLKSKEMDADFVLDQFKDMATKDYEHDPQRRERILRLIAAWNDFPAYESQILDPAMAAKGKLPYEDAETLNDLKMLESGDD